MLGCIKNGCVHLVVIPLFLELNCDTNYVRIKNLLVNHEIPGAEVKVQLVSPIGNVISSGGAGGLDGERVNALLNAFFLEQDSVNEEENRYDRLAQGYTYGADEEEREKVRKNGEDDNDLRSSILSILKGMLT